MPMLSACPEPAAFIVATRGDKWSPGGRKGMPMRRANRLLVDREIEHALHGLLHAFAKRIFVSRLDF